MNTDGYGEVINGIETYKNIAYRLKDYHSVIIGWTDEKSTHYDILFTYRAEREGMLQGGIDGSYLFVSIMRLGAFGFDVVAEDTTPDYYGEKLFVGGETAIKLAELINGVKKAMKNK